MANQERVIEQTQTQKPLVALTMGDPAGIGPEVILEAWRRGNLHAICRPLVIGSRARIRQQMVEDLSFEIIALDQIQEAAELSPSQIGVFEPSSAPDVSSIKPGLISPICGRAAYEYLIAATDLALANQVDAVVTLGLHKEALNQAGIKEPGHTEILARQCGVTDVAMMLYLPPEPGKNQGLGVVHATLHNALREVFELLTPQRLDAAIRLAHDAIMPLLNGPEKAPSIGVAALNPHAGEGGLFGDEEIRLIAPAVERALEAGIQAAGPFSADTLFGQALAGSFDAVVAMYHDQGHVALKTLGFDRAVNITCGLPIVRTSVAHGTAFDIVGKGLARAESLESATWAAARIAAWRQRQPKA